MNREQKAAVIAEVAGQIASAEGIFAVDYRGITVAQIADLREKLRQADTTLRVVKNSLSELAADRAGIGELKSLLEGPIALALVRGDVAQAAKVLSDEARALRGPLEFRGGVLNGTILTPDDVRSIARLPSRDVLHAQLVGTIAAPLSGLVRTLNALIAGLAVALKEVADKGLVSGTGRSGAPVDSGTEPASQDAPRVASDAAPAPEVDSPAPVDAPAEPQDAAVPEPEDAAVAEPEPVDAVAEPEPEVLAEAPEVEPEPVDAVAEPEPVDAEPVDAEPEPEPVDAEPEPEAEASQTEPTDETEGEAASDAADPSDE
ncbi:MAG: 50S ribosomal protein L10 [Solirubrobacteraceae bacterium]